MFSSRVRGACCSVCPAAVEFVLPVFVCTAAEEFTVSGIVLLELTKAEFVFIAEEKLVLSVSDCPAAEEFIILVFTCSVTKELTLLEFVCPAADNTASCFGSINIGC